MVAAISPAAKLKQARRRRSKMDMGHAKSASRSKDIILTNVTNKINFLWKQINIRMI